MTDSCSRYIVGAHVHVRENGGLAKEMMREVFGACGMSGAANKDLRGPTWEEMFPAGG
jgi:putative transposase